MDEWTSLPNCALDSEMVFANRHLKQDELLTFEITDFLMASRSSIARFLDAIAGDLTEKFIKERGWQFMTMNQDGLKEAVYTTILNRIDIL